MTRGEMHDYLLTLPNTVCGFQEEWNAFVYRIDTKMFAYIGNNKEEIEIITMKCDPERATVLREQYSDVVPGYYANKKHWNSIPVDNNIDDGFFKELMKHAHDVLFNSFSKKKQQELLNS